jgi:hypothetical protein
VAGDLDDVQIAVRALVDPAAVHPAGQPVQRVEPAGVLGVVLGGERGGQRVEELRHEG